jgi:hypothetical protein
MATASKSSFREVIERRDRNQKNRSTPDLYDPRTRTKTNQPQDEGLYIGNPSRKASDNPGGPIYATSGVQTSILSVSGAALGYRPASASLFKTRGVESSDKRRESHLCHSMESLAAFGKTVKAKSTQQKKVFNNKSTLDLPPWNVSTRPTSAFPNPKNMEVKKRRCLVFHRSR